MGRKIMQIMWKLKKGMITKIKENNPELDGQEQELEHWFIHCYNSAQEREGDVKDLDQDC